MIPDNLFSFIFPCAGISTRYVFPRIFMIFICIVFCVQDAESATPEKKDKKIHVLYINSYHPGYSWSDQIYSSINRVLTEQYGRDIDLRVEYLDGKRFSLDLESKLGEQVLSMWAAKYLNTSFDLLLVSDQDAYNLIRKARPVIFPGVPMIFGGVEELGKIDPNTTGILASTDIRGNIELILKLSPKTSRIWVITDNSTTGKINRAHVETIAKDFNGRVKIEFFEGGNGVEPGALLSRVGQVCAPDVIFFLDYHKVFSTVINSFDFLKILTDAAKVPMFSHIDLYIPCGVTGGKMNSGALQGRQMAQIGISILQGNSIDNIKIQTEDSLPTFDYLKLKKYDIALSMLPEKSIIINQPDGLWHKYGWYIVGIILFVIIESYLVVWLLFLFRRQQHLRIVSKAAAEQFKALFQLAPVPMAYFSLDGKIIDLNHQFLTVIGYTTEDVPSIEHWWTLAYPDPEYRKEVKTGWLNSIDAIILNGGSIKLREYRIRCKDEKDRIMELSASALGKNMLVCFIDVTERKQAESELRRANAILSVQQNISIDGILLVDEQMKILSFNHQFSEIWQVPENIIASHLDEQTLAFAKDRVVDPEEFFNKVQAIYQDKNLKIMDEVNLKNGKVLERYSAPMYGTDGTYYGRIWFFRDITERKRNELEREKLHEQLIQSQKMESVGRLAGGVAHDFNNMLGVIIGYAEFAMDGLDPKEPIYSNLQEILDAAQRSANLTRQLLAFARQQTVNPQVMNLNETVIGMLKMLQRLIGEDISLKWIPSHDPVMVKMDPTQIDQVLANLCVNARDAIRDVGIITIETRNVFVDESYCASKIDFIPGEYVLLTVSDNGCGMDKEIKDHIFEPFFTTKGIGKGTGLGLATVYGIVKQNNGFVNVYSELGKGTTIKIYIPKYFESISAKSVNPAVNPIRKGNETILLVEDEPMLLELGRKIIESLGYRVLPANSPNEAIQLAEKNKDKIHLLITDVIMPEMNGRELADRVLKLHPESKTLFMSGYTANVIAHHGVLDEGVNFIQKPFVNKDLVLKIQSILG